MKARRCLLRMTEPFMPHFADSLVTEVSVNQPGSYGVCRAGRWTWHDAPDLTFERLDAIGLAAASETSQQFSRQFPVCGSKLPGGQRIQVNRPPATHDDVIALSIRNPSERERTIDDPDFDELTAEANNGISFHEQASKALVELFEQKDWRGFFKQAIGERMTIGVCGSQNSGKTTLLKRYMQHIPDYHRVITIEDDSPEFGDAGPHNKVALFYGRSGLDAESILRAGLRMRADRLIFQELRGAEAFFFMRGMITGNTGMTTWHAEMGHEFEALAMMYRQSKFGQAIPHDDLARLIRQHIDIIVWVYHDSRKNIYRMPRVWFRGAESGE